MRYLKAYLIVAMAATALLAVVGASAASAETVLCTEKATKCPVEKTDGTGTQLKMSLVSGTRSKLTTPYNNIECDKASITAKVTSTGKTIGASVVGGWEFEECNCEVIVLNEGSLELQQISSTTNATVTSTGTEITTSCDTISGNVHCIYKTEATDLGTLEGGNPAKLNTGATEIPRLTTDALCAETTKWDAEYEVTSPKPVYIEPEAAPVQTILCTESATPCPFGKADGSGTEIKMSLVSGTKWTLTTSFKTLQCSKSSLTAKVTGTGKTISAIVEGFTFSECNCEMLAIKRGTLELERIKGTADATVKSSGAEITTICKSPFGTGHCIFRTEATDLGTLEAGNPAHLKTEGVPVPTESIACETAKWDAEYEVTSPKPIYIEPE